ncbi:Protein kinase domain-containing protein [Metarhizium brunneum]
MSDVNERTTSTPPWSVIEFSFSAEDSDSELVLLCNQTRLIIRLNASNLSDSPKLQEQYAFFLEVAENFGLNGYTVEDFYDWATEPLLPTLQELGPAKPTGKRTIQDFLSPPTKTFALRAVADNLVALPLEAKSDTELTPRFGISLSDKECTPWPSFHPSEVWICDQNTVGPPSQTPGRVILNNGIVAFFKIMRPGDSRSLKRELDAYRKILRAPLDGSLQISRLLGLVRNENGWVFGILLRYIDCSRMTLSCALKPATPAFLRQRWIMQLRQSVHQLHNAGIVWGDAKPDNVLIDSNKNAWVVDFGGGYTEGWVPKELVGTMDGDTIALEKMEAFVDADS